MADRGEASRLGESASWWERREQTRWAPGHFLAACAAAGGPRFFGQLSACSKLPYGAALNLNQSRAGLKSAICSTFSVFSSKLFQVCRGRVVGFGGAGVSGASRVSLVQAVRCSCWCKPGPDQARSPGMHRPGANLPPSLLHRL